MLIESFHNLTDTQVRAFQAYKPGTGWGTGWVRWITLRDRSLTYQFRFYRLNDSAHQQVARGRLTAVCAARQKDGSMKAVPLPTGLVEKIQEAPAQLLAEGSRSKTAPAPRGTHHSNPA